MLLTIIMWIVFGALAGWIASIILRSDEQQGAAGNIIIGILGAIIGGWLVQAFGGPSASGFSFYSLLVAILGAVILLGVVNFLRRGSARGV